MENTIGSIPEFTSNEVGEEQVAESATEAVIDKVTEPEKETPAEPAAAETPVVPEESVLNADTKEQKQVQGLLQEREKLLNEIKSLRGQRRELKQQELVVVDNKLEDLKDINPQDVNLIEKVLKSKGYVTKEEASQMHYDSVKQDEIAKFLEEFPEYKPENDPDDLNWSVLQREFSDYRLPNDPHRISQLLRKAHKAIVKVPSDRGIPEKRQQLKIASSGSGGTQRSSPNKQLDPDVVFKLREGGFSEEDIHKMESRL